MQGVFLGYLVAGVMFVVVGGILLIFILDFLFLFRRFIISLFSGGLTGE